MKIEMDNNTHDISTGILIVAVIICALLVCQPKCAAAESAIVSFNDAEHLVALQDSVVDICDTTIEVLEMAAADSLDFDSCMVADQWVMFYRFYFQNDTLWMPYWSSRSWSTRLTITCRELVCVTVVPEPYRCSYRHPTMGHHQLQEGKAMRKYRGIIIYVLSCFAADSIGMLIRYLVEAP